MLAHAIVGSVERDIEKKKLRVKIYIDKIRLSFRTWRVNEGEKKKRTNPDADRNIRLAAIILHTYA